MYGGLADAELFCGGADSRLIFDDVYGFPVKGFTESDCVAALMRMYQELTEKTT